MLEVDESDLTHQIDLFLAGSQLREDQIAQKIYSKLKNIALSKIYGELSKDVDGTVLVHEAFLKLINNKSGWKNRDHFFASASLVMRQILVDHARVKLSQKRGGAQKDLTFDEEHAADEQNMLVLKVNEMLESLETKNNHYTEVIELKFFAGLSNLEVAEALGISQRSVSRRWEEAKQLFKQYPI